MERQNMLPDRRFVKIEELCEKGFAACGGGIFF